MEGPSIDIVNRRQARLNFPDGTIFLLNVHLHSVQLLLNDEICGSVVFRSLASANSEEAKPLYQAESIQTSYPHLQTKQAAIIEAAIDLFRQYTGARIIASKALSGLTTSLL